MAKTPGSQCRGEGLNPGQGTRSRVHQGRPRVLQLRLGTPEYTNKIKFKKRCVHPTLCRFFLKKKEIMNCTQHSGMLGVQGPPAGSDFSSRTQASHQKKQQPKKREGGASPCSSPSLLAPRPTPGPFPPGARRCFPICLSQPFPKLSEGRQRRFFKGKAPGNLINAIFRTEAREGVACRGQYNKSYI